MLRQTLIFTSNTYIHYYLSMCASLINNGFATENMQHAERGYIRIQKKQKAVARNGCNPILSYPFPVKTKHAI
jgi:hypothetical protein